MINQVMSSETVQQPQRASWFPYSMTTTRAVIAPICTLSNAGNMAMQRLLSTGTINEQEVDRMAEQAVSSSEPPAIRQQSGDHASISVSPVATDRVNSREPAVVDCSVAPITNLRQSASDVNESRRSGAQSPAARVMRRIRSTSSLVEVAQISGSLDQAVLATSVGPVLSHRLRLPDGEVTLPVETLPALASAARHRWLQLNRSVASLSDSDLGQTIWDVRNWLSANPSVGSDTPHSRAVAQTNSQARQLETELRRREEQQHVREYEMIAQARTARTAQWGSVTDQQLERELLELSRQEFSSTRSQIRFGELETEAYLRELDRIEMLAQQALKRMHSFAATVGSPAGTDYPSDARAFWRPIVDPEVGTDPVAYRRAIAVPVGPISTGSPGPDVYRFVDVRIFDLEGHQLAWEQGTPQRDYAPLIDPIDFGPAAARIGLRAAVFVGSGAMQLGGRVAAAAVDSYVTLIGTIISRGYARIAMSAAIPALAHLAANSGKAITANFLTSIVNAVRRSYRAALLAAAMQGLEESAPTLVRGGAAGFGRSELPVITATVARSEAATSVAATVERNTLQAVRPATYRAVRFDSPRVVPRVPARPSHASQEVVTASANTATRSTSTAILSGAGPMVAGAVSPATIHFGLSAIRGVFHNETSQQTDLPAAIRPTHPGPTTGSRPSHERYTAGENPLGESEDRPVLSGPGVEAEQRNESREERQQRRRERRGSRLTEILRNLVGSRNPTAANTARLLQLGEITVGYIEDLESLPDGATFDKELGIVVRITRDALGAASPGLRRVYVRRRLGVAELIRTLIHEVNHVLQYGYRPYLESDTLNRYMDEFRAHWVQGVARNRIPLRRAETIHRMLMTYYGSLRNQYLWSLDFRREVDRFRARFANGSPFINTLNSPRLAWIEYFMANSTGSAASLINRLITTIGRMTEQERLILRNNSSFGQWVRASFSPNDIQSISSELENEVVPGADWHNVSLPDQPYAEEERRLRQSWSASPAELLEAAGGSGGRRNQRIRRRETFASNYLATLYGRVRQQVEQDLPPTQRQVNETNEDAAQRRATRITAVLVNIRQIFARRLLTGSLTREHIPRDDHGVNDDIIRETVNRPDVILVSLNGNWGFYRRGTIVFTRRGDPSHIMTAYGRGGRVPQRYANPIDGQRLFGNPDVRMGDAEPQDQTVEQLIQGARPDQRCYVIWRRPPD